MRALGVNDLLQAAPVGQPLEEALAHAEENLSIAAKEFFLGMSG